MRSAIDADLFPLTRSALDAGDFPAHEICLRCGRLSPLKRTALDTEEDHVYAIEASDIAVQASEVVKANNLLDKVIVIHERVERRQKAKSDQVLVLSTAPEDEPTHWQQTILYLYEPIEVIHDQKIEGSITLSQSRENPRFLNNSSGGRSFMKESIMR